MPLNPDNPRKKRQTADDMRRVVAQLRSMAETLDTAAGAMEDAGMEAVSVDAVKLLPKYLGKVKAYVGNCDKEVYSNIPQ